MQNITAHAFRLKPGEDLKKSIQKIVQVLQIKAGWISTCVGSLTTYTIRFANQANASSKTGYFEIFGLTGTVSINGLHLHILVSDDTGQTIGGHLCDGCIVYTTAEIIICNRLPLLSAPKGLVGIKLTNHSIASGAAVVSIVAGSSNPVTPAPGCKHTATAIPIHSEIALVTT